MQELNRTNFQFARSPEKILQIGEGNFLRCFIGWMIDILNEKTGLDAGIVVARPIDTDQPPSLDTQDGLYTTMLRGYDADNQLRDEKRIVSAVTREISIYRDYNRFLELAGNRQLRFIVSNTTEAGIAYCPSDRFDDRPPSSFPAKLTRFLHERFTRCHGAPEQGLILLPCELLDDNGEKLREIVLRYIDLWNLSDGFRSWVLEANTFCSTLVDRIVTGYPHQEAGQLERQLGYKDRFMVTGEFFHLFIIHAPPFVGRELGIADSGLHIEIVDNLKPYKERKVGILNGCHTALAPIAQLCGIEFVKDAIADPLLENYLKKLLAAEIIPSLSLPRNELTAFSDSVIGRFKNPFINHKLLDISLNAMTKFRTRILPQLLRYHEDNGTVPPLMSAALAALICFYRGTLNGRSYPLKDDRNLLDLYQDLWSGCGDDPVDSDRATAISRGVLELNSHWETDLLAVDGLLEQVAADVAAITARGMRATLKEKLQ